MTIRQLDRDWHMLSAVVEGMPDVLIHVWLDLVDCLSCAALLATLAKAPSIALP